MMALKSDSGSSFDANGFWAEEDSATATAGEAEEHRRKDEANDRVEAGKATVAFGFSVLLGCLCFLPNDAKHKNSVSFSICFFLAFATFVSGNALMLLSMNMLDLRADLVSDGKYVAAKCLAISCSVLSVLTLFSLVALPRSWQYRYIGLAAVTVVLLLAAGVLLLYLWRRTGGSDDEAHNEEELEAAAKITSCITNSSFGGLVGVLFNSSGAATAEDVDRAAYVAIFFLFATAILGMLVMTVTKKVPRITQRRFQRRFITVIKLANASLLCSLACAPLAAAFAVLRYRILAAFAPLVTTGIICFLLGHCAPGEANDEHQQENQEQLEAIEDLASKVTFGGIMSVLGGTIGANYNYNSQPSGVRDTFVVVLTSAFVSGLGIMLLAGAPPGSARALLAPVAKVLVWSSVALFAGTAVSVYSVELLKM